MRETSGWVRENLLAALIVVVVIAVLGSVGVRQLDRQVALAEQRLGRPAMAITEVPGESDARR